MTTQTIDNCGYSCLTYRTSTGEYDVAGYSPSCPVHGWRYEYSGQSLSLAEAELHDRDRLEPLIRDPGAHHDHHCGACGTELLVGGKCPKCDDRNELCTSCMKPAPLGLEWCQTPQCDTDLRDSNNRIPASFIGENKEATKSDWLAVFGGRIVCPCCGVDVTARYGSKSHKMGCELSKFMAQVALYEKAPE